MVRVISVARIPSGENNPFIDPLLLSYFACVPERLACETTRDDAVVVEDHLKADGTGVLNDFVHALERGLGLQRVIHPRERCIKQRFIERLADERARRQLVDGTGVLFHCVLRIVIRTGDVTLISTFWAGVASTICANAVGIAILIGRRRESANHVGIRPWNPDAIKSEALNLFEVVAKVRAGRRGGRLVQAAHDPDRRFETRPVDASQANVVSVLVNDLVSEGSKAQVLS